MSDLQNLIARLRAIAEAWSMDNCPPGIPVSGGRNTIVEAAVLIERLSKEAKRGQA